MITFDQIDLKNISPAKLGELLLEAKKAYYTSAEPIMDDHTYDTLEEILRLKAPHHRFFTKIGTPNFDTGFDKKKHLMPMGSQNKVNKYNDLIHYFELKKSAVGSNVDMRSISYVVQPKCDGISLEIVYKNGELIEAITRGDGITGDVITQNVVKMKNLPLSLPKKFSGSIRCEIMVTKKDFEKLNVIARSETTKQSPVDRHEPSALTMTYSNPRNAASGLSQRLDGKYSEYCTLMAVDILNNVETSRRGVSTKSISTESDKISLLKSLGFTPVESILCQTFEQIETIYQQFLTKKRFIYPYEIDGLVVKINDLDLAEKLGSKNNRPKYQVAYKFPAATNQTQIKKVVWQVGPLGTITPVAEVDPVEISGATITFASLANYQLIKEKNINVGDIVEITRRGDVIPHIEKVINKVTKGHIDIPQYCPFCKTLLIVEDKYIRCPNSQNCLPQILGSLRLFCDSLDILGLSDKTIAKLYSAGKIKTPGDFYKLKISDISNLDNLGEKSAKKIISQIQGKKTLTLKQIFDAAAIPNLSHARIQQLIKTGFDTPEKLLNITQNELLKLPGFQKTLAKKIIDGLNFRRNWILSILSEITPKDQSTSALKLSNLSFAITGNLSLPRSQFIELIETQGGKFVSTVSKNTDYLLTNETDSTSSKFKLAKKFNVKIINEEQLKELISSR